MVPAVSPPTRGLSLRAPIGNEEERTFFQRRLALTSFVTFVLAGGFWVCSVLITLAMDAAHVSHAWTRTSSQFQIATTCATGALWLLLRARKQWSAVVLDSADVSFAVLLCTGWALMSVTDRAFVRPELTGLLACTYTLVLRAALLPSSPARTTVLGIFALAPLVLITRALHAGNALMAGADVYIGLWAVLGVSATRTISWVIYGLRKQVRDAKQLGQYLLEEKIGEGGMGAVYRASHAMLRRPTAIKLLRTSSSAALDRFEREVRITARLTHPNTVAVFDYGRTPDGVFYYAMELLEGTSLEDLVVVHGPQPIERVVHILLQACGALQEAHGEGLVHRDIKPANLMLTRRGGVLDVVKVLDFGLVKEVDASADAARTQSDVILGTPHFMAPESFTDAKNVDGRADLYALGASAFYLLTGQRVFDGRGVIEVCGKHLHEPPSPPSMLRPDIPPALDAVVLRCLAKKREERFPDAAALAAELRALHVREWSQDDARAWWSEHEAPAVSGITKAGADDSASGPHTVAVALEGRV